MLLVLTRKKKACREVKVGNKKVWTLNWLQVSVLWTTKKQSTVGWNIPYSRSYISVTRPQARSLRTPTSTFFSTLDKKINLQTSGEILVTNNPKSRNVFIEKGFWLSKRKDVWKKRFIPIYLYFSGMLRETQAILSAQCIPMTQTEWPLFVLSSRDNQRVCF